MLKSAENCQMLSPANEMAAASLKAGCKGTMMWGPFAIFDEERGFKKAKRRCGSNPSKVHRLVCSGSQWEDSLAVSCLPNW